MQKNDIRFRWLGVCGIELGYKRTTLLIDPYFTRLKAYYLWFGRPVSNSRVIHKHIRHADHILITHSHFDHLLDAAEILHHTGAIAHGSPNTIELLRRRGIPSSQLQLIRPNEWHHLGSFDVEALEAGLHHPPGYGPGKLSSPYRLPMKAADYRMDTVMAYKIHVAGLNLLFEHCLRSQEALPVDILFLEPYASLRGHARVEYTRIIQGLQPNMVIPVHWDDMMAPLDKPVVGQILPKRSFFFPLKRFDFQQFRETIETIRPQTHVFLPDRLKEHGLKSILANTLPPRVTIPTFSLVKINILKFLARNLSILRRQLES